MGHEGQFYLGFFFVVQAARWAGCVLCPIILAKYEHVIGRRKNPHKISFLHANYLITN